jgi:hypothetical protein
MAVQGLLRGVLGRIKQRLLVQLLEDYRRWSGQAQEPAGPILINGSLDPALEV